MLNFQNAHRLLTVSCCYVQMGRTIAVGGVIMTEDISRRLLDFYQMEGIQIEFAKVCTVGLVLLKKQIQRLSRFMKSISINPKALPKGDNLSRSPSFVT